MSHWAFKDNKSLGETMSKEEIYSEIESKINESKREILSVGFQHLKLQIDSQDHFTNYPKLSSGELLPVENIAGFRFTYRPSSSADPTIYTSYESEGNPFENSPYRIEQKTFNFPKFFASSAESDKSTLILRVDAVTGTERAMLISSDFDSTKLNHISDFEIFYFV